MMMRFLEKALLAAPLFGLGVALATPGYAGVMSVTDKASISLATPTAQVDWRPYYHNHHRWHHARWGYAPRWGHRHWGYRHWGYGPRWGHRHWGYRHWGYRRWGYAPAWGYGAYAAAAPNCYGTSTWGYNPVGGLLGAAAGVAAAPLWAAGTVANPYWW
jgi:hypothetical protein